MIHPPRVVAALTTAVCLLVAPAWADTATFTMDGTWQKIASSGTSVDVQNATTTVAVLSTSSGVPVLGNNAGHILVGGDHRCWTLTADLYAIGGKPGQLQVLTGVSCGGGGGGSGTTVPNPIGIIGGQATVINRSGSITLGGAAQSLMAANASRHGCWIQNLSTGDEWINENGGTAAANQPNIWIPPGAYWPCPETGVPTPALSIFGAVTGQTFSAREW